MLQTADTRPHHHAGTELVLIGFGFPAGIFNGIAAGRQTVQDKLVNFLLVFRSHNRIGVKVVFAFAEGTCPAISTGNIFQIDSLDFANSGLPVQNTFFSYIRRRVPAGKPCQARSQQLFSLIYLLILFHQHLFRKGNLTVFI